MADFPRSLKIATVWLLVGGTLFLAIQAWEAQRHRARVQVDGAAVELRRSPDGHFHWPGRVHGVAVDFLVDTGATGTALPAALARQAGLLREGSVRSNTAGGVAEGWLARADIDLQGGVRAERLRVIVLPELSSPLLGMDLLSRLHFSQRGEIMRIEAPR